MTIIDGRGFKSLARFFYQMRQVFYDMMSCLK
jgi:hypothetical protein